MPYYYKNKGLNKEKAKTHTYEMQELFSEDIKHSIDNSVVYVLNNIKSDFSDEKPPRVIVENQDTVSSILEHMNDHNLAALNFASFRNPGGQYINGSMAQEEALCSESFLYNVLREIPDYYVNNKGLLNKGLYYNKAIYSPDIYFERGRRYTKCGIITCAAPNLSYYHRFHSSLDMGYYLELLYNRMIFLKLVAQINNIKTLILGAWGCGVFANSPIIVAAMFKEAFEKTTIDNIIYAVPSNRDGDDNFRVFNEMLGEVPQ